MVKYWMVQNRTIPLYWNALKSIKCRDEGGIQALDVFNIITPF